MNLFIKQDVFDTVLNHLRKQGPATSATGRCAYRTAEGKSCAVGVLIPDDMYDPTIEGSSVPWALPVDEVQEGQLAGRDRALRSVLRRLYPLMTNEDVALLTYLQMSHDFCADGQWQYFEGRMADCARRFGLVYTKPN